MSLPNSTVSTVVKPVYKTDHYYHYGTPYLSFYVLLCRKKNQSNIVVSQAVRFVLYKNYNVKFISSQNTISFNSFMFTINIMRFEAQRQLI